jgi:hypothetical protein
LRDRTIWAALLSTTVAAGILLGPAVPAGAEPKQFTVSPEALFELNEKAANGTDSIANLYAKSRRDPTLGTARKADFMRQAAAEGRYYDAGSVDYLKLQRTDDVQFKDVEVVTPRNYQMQSIRMREALAPTPEDKYRVRLEVGATGSSVGAEDSAVAYPDGPGFTSFSIWSSGQYNLYTDSGWMLATWQKEKVIDDLDGSADYWAYKRKGVVAVDAGDRDQFGIDLFDIWAYPYTSVPINNWVGWTPSPGHYEGNCDTLPLTLSLAYRAASTAISFVDCEDYGVAIAGSRPGDMSVRWDDFWDPDGPRETAFEFVVAVPEGRIPSWNDYQGMAFYMHNSGWYRERCESRNASKDCR